jgi:hypothetical protein
MVEYELICFLQKLGGQPMSYSLSITNGLEKGFAMCVKGNSNVPRPLFMLSYQAPIVLGG